MAWKTIGVKVQDDFKTEVDEIAAKNGKTTSDFVRICVEDAVHGHYTLEGEHLVPTEEYLNALRPIGGETSISDEPNDGWEYHEFKFDKLVNVLRDKDYPDEYIREMVGNMIYAAYDRPRFDPRKKRGEDWGA